MPLLFVFYFILILDKQFIVYINKWKHITEITALSWVILSEDKNSIAIRLFYFAAQSGVKHELLCSIMHVNYVNKPTILTNGGIDSKNNWL